MRKPALDRLRDLGWWRGAVLVEVIDRTKKKAYRRSSCLLDLKQAIDPAAPAMRSAGLPDDAATRVVAGARKIAPALGERMVAAKMLDRSVFVRELMPQDLEVELDRFRSKMDGRSLTTWDSSSGEPTPGGRDR
ncbi:MAG TPA: DUF2252 family protein [Kofleriaceae bacterium]|nr:DUF2252 family protein [Kofleriaceae bacterium]